MKKTRGKKQKPPYHWHEVFIVGEYDFKDRIEALSVAVEAIKHYRKGKERPEEFSKGMACICNYAGVLGTFDNIQKALKTESGNRIERMRWAIIDGKLRGYYETPDDKKPEFAMKLRRLCIAYNQLKNQ